MNLYQQERVPKDFRSQCQDTRQVSLLRAVVARGAANHREGLAHGEGGRLSIFFRDALVCWRGWYKVGPLPVDKWTYNFYKWPYTWVTGGYNPTSGSYNSIYNDRRAHLVGRAFFVTLQMDL